MLTAVGRLRRAIYRGSGLTGREITNIHSSEMVVVLGGRSGTLGEFAIAYDEGKLIRKLKETYTSEHYKRPSCFCNEASASGIGDRGSNEQELR
jgi:hypothetical protein